MQLSIAKSCAQYLRHNINNSEIEKLKPSHAYELVAAFFGYKSHAALLSERKYPLKLLEEATWFIPDLEFIGKRRDQLEGISKGLPDVEGMVRQLCEYLKELEEYCPEIVIYDSFTSYVMEEVVIHAQSHIDDELSGVMAETNAYFDDLYPEEAKIVRKEDSVIVEVTGVYGGRNHDDKMFCGDKLNIGISVEFPRIAGWTAFDEPEIRAGGQVDDSWVDPDVKYGRL